MAGESVTDWQEPLREDPGETKRFFENFNVAEHMQNYDKRYVL